MSLRVLFVNARPDALENPGGDTVQVRETRAALEAVGVSIYEVGATKVRDLPDFDLAHVFNLQMTDSAAAIFAALKPLARPVVFSPIYWDLLPTWFDSALETAPHWRFAARILGREPARRLYVSWQRRKEPKSALWQQRRALLLEAAAVLPNSRAEAELLGSTFALPGAFADACDVVPNGVDRRLYEQEPAPSPWFAERYGIRDFVLQVGTISPVKNQLALIEALTDVPVPLVIIGHTPKAMTAYAAECRRRAEARGNVVFIDHLPSGELPGIYALAAVHALPSWRETPGLVSLEAAACGCRIVTTSEGSTKEYFGEGAWYCHPSNVASIRRAVTSALASPKSPAMRQRVLERFTWSEAGRATLAAYARVAPRPSARPA
jgi:glycosyltransferase involved in cell wall biosynthesis